VSFHAKLVLTVIVVAFGPTSANPQGVDDYLRKKAPGPIKQFGAVVGGTFGGPAGAYVGREIATWGVARPAPGRPYYSQQSQQVPPNHGYQQQSPYYVGGSDGGVHGGGYPAAPIYGNRCWTFAGWDYVPPAPLGTPCTVIAYDFGGVPRPVRGQIVSP
jgi:hypothetical protein